MESKAISAFNLKLTEAEIGNKLKFGGKIQKSTILVGRAAGRVGEMESKAISASNLKLKLTEADLGNYHNV